LQATIQDTEQNM